MLVAHPVVLRNLVARHTALRSLTPERQTPQTRRQLDDVSYTLCVSTGTRTVEDALSVAHARLAEATPVPTPRAGSAEGSAILTV